jgi:hypothetical protein
MANYSSGRAEGHATVVPIRSPMDTSMHGALAEIAQLYSPQKLFD